MIKFLKNHAFISISIFSFILLLVPIVIFINNFGGNTISNDLSDWASFGDFMGGTINIVLSLTSLIILAILTNTVSKQSNQENKNINLLIRRMDSYEILSKYLTEIELAHVTGTIDLGKAKDSLYPHVKRIFLDKLEERFVVHFELYALLISFRIRFSQLYQYDFDSKSYRNLVEASKKVKNNLMIISKDDIEFEGDFAKDYEEFFDLFHELLETLKKELK